VVDTPPLLAVTDPCVVASRVDGVLLTLKLGKNSRPVAERAKEILAGLGATMIGVVVNGVAGKDAAAGYGYEHYSYGYAYSDDYTSTEADADRSSPPAEAAETPSAAAEGSSNGPGADGAAAGPPPAAGTGRKSPSRGSRNNDLAQLHRDGSRNGLLGRMLGR